MRVIAGNQLTIKQVVESDELLFGQPYNQKSISASEVKQVEPDKLLMTSSKQCQDGVCGIDQSWLRSRRKSNKND